MQILLLCTIIIVHYSSAVLSVKLSPCARWNQTGVIVAGNGQSGKSSSQLNSPRGIFIRQATNTLYVADTKNNRIQMFLLNQSSTSGTTVASTTASPRRIFVDEDNGPTIYVSLDGINRVEKWIDGTSEGIQVGGECRKCEGVAVDKEKNVYMTEFLYNQVIKWSPTTNSSTVIVTQTNGNTSIDERLFSPEGIYIDNNDGSLYVTNSFYDRIQKWPKNGRKGFTVARSDATNPLEDSELLKSPNAVLVDEETEMMYFTEPNKKRVQRWLINATKGKKIAGRSGPDAQLGTPTDLAFDKDGNLYVCDFKYHQVMMFALIDNRPCHGTATTETTTTTTTTPKNQAFILYEYQSDWMIMIIFSLSSVIILQ